MEPDAYAKRLADYKKHPKRADDTAILLAEDEGVWKILDGRHHYLICKELGYKCRFEKVSGDRDELADIAESRGINRRHQTETQIAAAMVVLNEFRNGGDRKSSAFNQSAPVHSDSEKTTKRKGKTQTEAAKASGVSKRTIASASVAAKAEPELLAAMRDGKLDAKTAEKVAKLPAAERKKVAKAKDPKKAAREALKKKPAASESPTDAEQEAAIAALEADTKPDPAAFVAAVETLCRDIDQIARRMKELKTSPLSYPMHVDSAVSQVEAARKTLWQGRPAHECPYCHGEGCKTCNGTGRVKKTTYDSGMEAVGGGK